MAEPQPTVKNFKLFKPFRKFPKSNQNQFSIISWNTLIKTDTGKNPSDEHSKWEYRLSNIHKTILSFDSDIICLQECDTESFQSDFTDFCIKNKYDYQLNLSDYANTQQQIQKATDDIKLNKLMQYGQMTTAILWKKDKFKYKYHDFRTKTTILLLEMKSDEKQQQKHTSSNNCNKKKKKKTSAFDLYLRENNLSKSDAYHKWKLLTTNEKEIYINNARKLKQEKKANEAKDKELEMIELKDNMKRYLFIINVHLEAHGKYETNEKQLNKSEQRFNQIRHSIEKVINYVKNVLKLDDMECVNAVFCGDFNEGLNSEIHKMLIGNDKMNGNNYNNEKVLNKKDFKNEFKLKNAYSDNIIEFEKRNDIMSHWISERLIDHFYYTYNNLKCIICMETVPECMKCEGNVMKMGYPNKYIVSDHLPIASMFEIVRNEEEGMERKRKLEEVEQNEPNKKKRKLND